MSARGRRGLEWLLGALLIGTTVQAEPTLHEFFEPDPVEDLKLGATTRGGAVPAAIETESGVVPAPADRRERTASTPTYGGTSTPNSSDASYRIDRDTTRPSRVSYDDPFTPPITPFKRLFAYDAVNESSDLYVQNKALSRLEIGGTPRLGEDSFYADLFVDLAADVPVRIPSVGPGTRVLAAEVEPNVQFEILRDGVDNWYIKSGERRRARLIMQLSIERAVFGSPYGDVSWEALARFVSALPRALREQARGVLDTLGLSRTLTPREVVARMVAHFRSFAPSEDLPQARSGKQLYAELALSKKGVCRHRAYAFVVTALALGIPTRLVRNEAHAWVEVYDAKRWHRIDLGGAAGELDSREDPEVSPYRSPSDPFTWPEGSASGLGLANDARNSRQTAPGPDGTDRNRTGRPSPTASAQADEAGDEPTEKSLPGPKAELSLRAEDPSVRRGHRLRLAGMVRAEGESCGAARVDVSLVGSSGKRVAIGALPSDADGNFQGSVTVPLSISVGDYQLRVSTPGTQRCGPSD
jgi:transglutaminase-like putative cysteine protease